MALILGFPTEEGVERLLAQPADIVPRDPTLAQIDRAEASGAHRALFEGYREDIRTAYGIAEPWWADTIAAQRALGLDETEALRAAFTKRLAGPAAHPKVVWIVRNYWLDCCDLNSGGRSNPEVYAETLLLRWLIHAGENDLVALVACMPYWPIGLDENGNWC